MALDKATRERLSDSRLRLQTVARSLKKVDPKDIPNLEGVESCLEDADRSLTLALKNADPDPGGSS